MVGLSKVRLKAVFAVGAGAVVAAFLIGWCSGSYNLPAHLERYREIQELRARNAELSREISERKDYLEAVKRGELPAEVLCSLPSGRYRGFEPVGEQSRVILLSVGEANR